MISTNHKTDMRAEVPSPRRAGEAPSVLPQRRRPNGAHWGLMAMVAGAGASAAGAQDSTDITTLPPEDLLSVEVTTAPKFAQKPSEAPSYVSVLSATDIKTCGYRTLAEILRSVPGFFVSNDRPHEFPDARGFARPGDFNSRVPRVDGSRLNDAAFVTASIGTEFPIDIDLIVRVEFVGEPGSREPSSVRGRLPRRSPGS